MGAPVPLRLWVVTEAGRHTEFVFAEDEVRQLQAEYPQLAVRKLLRRFCNWSARPGNVTKRWQWREGSKCPAAVRWHLTHEVNAQALKALKEKREAMERETARKQAEQLRASLRSDAPPVPMPESVRRAIEDFKRGAGR